MTKKLEGKVALVTGGSRGMGAAIARRLAEDGADVAISYAASAEKVEANVRQFEVKGYAQRHSRPIKADPVPILLRLAQPCVNGSGI